MIRFETSIACWLGLTLLAPGAVSAQVLDDASRLQATAMAGAIPVPSDPAAAEATVRQTLAQARATRRPITVAGAAHTMGGHTLAPGGVRLQMDALAGMTLDPAARLLHVGAGARWSQVVPYLDARGFSPAVMQSNNDFSIGGSLSANCHGWQVNRAPIAGSVESFRLMTADGTVRDCSRTQHPELFKLALGGYGLFGVILDARLRVIPNEQYSLRRTFLTPEAYPAAFARQVETNPAVGMAYGRLSIAPHSFMREAILNVFERAPLQAGQAFAPLTDDPTNPIKRWMFLASLGESPWKRWRWEAERLVEPEISGTFVNRNQLLNESAEVYAERTPGSTDLLHEYFVPRDRLPAFVAQVKTLVPKHEGDLLNLTLRDVTTDADSFLRYADQPMFALVMYFHQARTPAAEARMRALTEALVEASLSVGGRYYLPYRPHATLAQFRRAYPQAGRFFALKRKWDPAGLFQNSFSMRYGD